MAEPEFYARVSARAGVPVETARALTEATLRTLAERISGGEADDLSAHVAHELRPLLARARVEDPEVFGYDEFLRRIAERAFIGIGRTGSSFSNGSGDYAIAFSTHAAVRREEGKAGAVGATAAELRNEAMSPLFQAAAEATEEAVINSLFAARTVTGHRGTAEQLPLDKVLPWVAGAGK